MEGVRTLILGFFSMTVVFLGISWEGRREVLEDVEGASIILQDGETEAAAVLSRA